jgi:hypothetical protein
MHSPVSAAAQSTAAVQQYVPVRILIRHLGQRDPGVGDGVPDVGAVGPRLGVVEEDAAAPALRESGNSPSASGFPECQISGTRGRNSSPSVALG